MQKATIRLVPFATHQVQPQLATKYENEPHCAFSIIVTLWSLGIVPSRCYTTLTKWVRTNSIVPSNLIRIKLATPACLKVEGLASSPTVEVPCSDLAKFKCPHTGQAYATSNYCMLWYSTIKFRRTRTQRKVTRPVDYLHSSILLNVSFCSTSDGGVSIPTHDKHSAPDGGPASSPSFL